MRIMSTKEEDLIFFIDVTTGFKFIGQGPFLFGEFIEKTFTGKIVSTPYFGEVNSAAYVSYRHCDQEHFLYTECIEDIPALFKLVNPDMNPSIVVHPKLFSTFLMEGKVLRMPTTPPGQGKSLSRFDENG